MLAQDRRSLDRKLLHEAFEFEDSGGGVIQRFRQSGLSFRVGHGFAVTFVDVLPKL